MVFRPGGRPQTRYVETSTGYLASQVFGSGDRDVMFITGAMSNADAIWEEPSAARFFDRLSRLGRVIRYDMRGSGESDPIPCRNMWMTIEENVDDVLAVLDAAGSEKAVVYGDTEGSLSATTLAATHPDRVSALILVHPVPHLGREEGYSIGAPAEVTRELSRLYTAQHGTTGEMLELTAPGVANDLRFRNWWTRYQRLSIPFGLVKTTFDWFAEVDVRAVLPFISAPTLVLGRRAAKFHRPEYARFVANQIPGAELRILDGADTLPFHAGDFGQVLDEVERFLTGETGASAADRVLATVLFTDIVGSTALASSMGDQRWIDLLDEHNRIVRQLLERFRGREIKMTGDGCIATFDGPARAVSCAVGIVDQISALGLQVRAGIHTGEVELREDDVAGVGVHIASRVMDQAESGGILVSGTVKDLVVGSNIEFTHSGSHELKGVPGTWDLYEPKIR